MLVEVLDVFFTTLGARLWSIISAPAQYPGMIWILFPMVVTLLLMTFYFGRYRREELGWNTAVGNALVLFFVSVNLLQQVYPQENPIRALLVFFRTLAMQGFSPEAFVPGFVAGGLLVYSIILLTADFNHWLPKKFAFFISSGLPVNILAYFGIIFVYGGLSETPLPLDWYTYLAFFILFLLLWSVLHFLQFLEPKKDDIDDAPAVMDFEDEGPTVLIEK